MLMGCASVSLSVSGRASCRGAAQWPARRVPRVEARVQVEERRALLRPVRLEPSEKLFELLHVPRLQLL